MFMSDRPTCETCRFFDVAVPGSEKGGPGGFCRRHAPTAFAGNDEDWDAAEAMWPWIDNAEENWCGEHRPVLMDHAELRPNFIPHGLCFDCGSKTDPDRPIIRADHRGQTEICESCASKKEADPCSDVRS